ncbi:DUF2939 domain-containing protein [Halochromatium sp.]
MARFLGLLLLLGVVLYGIWPYYSILQINRALQDPEAEALAPLVDLAAIQSHYKKRVEGTVEGLLPRGSGHQPDGPHDRQGGAASERHAQTGLQLDADQVLDWLSDNLKTLGSAALDQAITLDWARETLLAASQRAAGQRHRQAGAQGGAQTSSQTGTRTGTSFIEAVDFAFFESWDRFVIRLGRLGQRPTFVILTLDGTQWRVTDITS